LRQPRAGRHGRREFSNSGAPRLPYVRRLEALRLRRPQPARPGLDPVLHKDQDGHLTLADRDERGCRVCHPDHEVELIRDRAGTMVVRAATGLLAVLPLAGCAGDQLSPGSSAPAPAPVEDSMPGRWILAAPNAPSCGLEFGGAPGARSGTVSPDGGCPANFYM